MANDKQEPRPWIAPIFLVADDDSQAIRLLLEQLHDDWTYIPVENPRVVAKYASEIAVTAVFLADGMQYPRGGSAALLQRILDESGKPVVILAEIWSPEIAERWKRMGAVDCIPHPTRSFARMGTLLSKFQELAVAHQALRPRKERVS